LRTALERHKTLDLVGYFGRGFAQKLDVHIAEPLGFRQKGPTYLFMVTLIVLGVGMGIRNTSDGQQ
jgi:hypothetical protein